MYINGFIKYIWGGHTRRNPLKVVMMGKEYSSPPTLPRALRAAGIRSHHRRGPWGRRVLGGEHGSH